MEIKGRDIYKIRPIAHLQNKAYDVEDGHPFYGQSYSTFQFDDKPFNVNSSDEFVQWRDGGILYSVTFVESTYKKEIDGVEQELKSLRLLSCTNIHQETVMARGEAMLAKIYRDAEVSDVDADFMSEFVKN